MCLIVSQQENTLKYTTFSVLSGITVPLLLNCWPIVSPTSGVEGYSDMLIPVAPESYLWYDPSAWKLWLAKPCSLLLGLKLFYHHLLGGMDGVICKSRVINIYPLELSQTQCSKKVWCRYFKQKKKKRLQFFCFFFNEFASIRWNEAPTLHGRNPEHLLQLEV